MSLADPVDHPQWDLLRSLDTDGDRAMFASMYELYVSSFPEESERESREKWQRILEGQSAPYRLEFVVARAGEEVVGGTAFEYYPVSNCGLITFLFVREDARGRGIAREMVQRAHGRLTAGRELRHLFAEAEDPERVEEAGIASAIDPRTRLAVLARLGAYAVPIRYIQPALEPGQRQAEHLMLLSMGPRAAAPIERAGLVAFLREFYASLDVSADESERLIRHALADVQGDVIPVIPLT